ncbi:MAG: peptide deformylase [Patescibacteria group bacterium]
MILNILTYPDENLRKKSVEISSDEIKSAKFQQFIDNLSETMLKEDGAGLAAPQVDIQKRIVVVNTDGSGNAKEFINPKILNKSFRKSIIEEGCLSVPGRFEKVRRPKKIKIRYQDRKGVWHKHKCDDYLSRVLQHEIDHLDGILFIDKIIK